MIEEKADRDVGGLPWKLWVLEEKILERDVEQANTVICGNSIPKEVTCKSS